MARAMGGQTQLDYCSDVRLVDTKTRRRAAQAF